MRSKLVPILLNSVPGWVRSNYGLLVPSVVTHYDEGRAWVQGFGNVDPTSLITTVRASTGYAATSAGGLNLFPANTPRITDLGLLVEQAATNLAVKSQAYSGTSWARANVTAADNNVVAPDGTTTGALITATTAVGHCNVEQSSFTPAAATTYAMSFYAKQGTTKYVGFGFYNGTADQWQSFDVNAGTVQTTTGTNFTVPTITALANGWYRVSVVLTTPASGSFSGIKAALSDTANFNINNATNGVTAYFWGFQAETGALATSYIPTPTVSVTRAADAITFKNINLPAPYSLFISVGPSAKDSADLLLGGTVNDGSLLRISGTTGVLNVIEGGVTTASITNGTMTIGTPFKMAGRFAVNDANVSMGGLIGTHDTSTTPPTLTALGFGRALYGFGSDVGSVYFKRTTLFRSGLSDAQLQALTT